MRLVPATVALLACARLARADDVDDLVARGEELARQHEYTQAIAAFKQADARRPRAAHACMIGLAYMRRELWPQAELFFARCEKRAAPGDQPPDWIDTAHHELATKLRAAHIPAITIDVSPPRAGALLTVSSFAPDERFEAQTIHLAPGKHVIEVTAPGYHRASREILVESGEAQTVTFALAWDSSAQRRESSTSKTNRSLTPWIVGGVGGVLLGGGIAYDLAALQPARNRLEKAETGIAYDAYADGFRTKRYITVGLIAAGALVLGTGIVLGFTMSASVDRDGAAVALQWQR